MVCVQGKFVNIEFWDCQLKPLAAGREIEQHLIARETIDCPDCVSSINPHGTHSRRQPPLGSEVFPLRPLESPHSATGSGPHRPIGFLSQRVHGSARGGGDSAVVCYPPVIYKAEATKKIPHPKSAGRRCEQGKHI